MRLFDTAALVRLLAVMRTRTSALRAFARAAVLGIALRLINPIVHSCRRELEMFKLCIEEAAL